MISFKELRENVLQESESTSHDLSIAALEDRIKKLGFKKSGQDLSLRKKGNINNIKKMVTDYVSAIEKLGGPKRIVNYYPLTNAINIR